MSEEIARRKALFSSNATDKGKLLADIKSGDFWRVKEALENLAMVKPAADDQGLVAAIYAATKHDSPFIRDAAHAALNKWAPELARKAKLNEDYSKNEEVQPSDRPITNSTPLSLGIILCARDRRGFRPVEVREVLADGRVKVSFRGFAVREEVLSRDDLWFPPDEVDQPALGGVSTAALLAKLPNNGAGVRTPPGLGRRKAENRMLLADIKSGDVFRVREALEKLTSVTPADDEDELVAAIYAATKHDAFFIRDAAHAALSKWSPDLERKAKLNEAYGDSREVQPTDKPVTDSTPLPAGLILCAKDSFGWRAVEVREVLADGKVRVAYRGWRSREGTFARTDLRLAPDEVDQPALAASPNVPKPSDVPVSGAAPKPPSGPAFRTWTDNTGSFQVEAQYVGMDDDKVQLRRRDGREIKVPLTRLSQADQEELKYLQQDPQATRPLKP